MFSKIMSSVASGGEPINIANELQDHSILVVCASVESRKSWAATMGPGWRVHYEYGALIGRASDLRLSVSATPMSAAIVDFDSIGSDLRTVRAIREIVRDVPMLVVCTNVNSQVVNALHLLQTELVAKDDCAQNLRAFLRRVKPEGNPPSGRLTEVLAEHGLTKRELEVVRAGLVDSRRRSIADALCLSEETVKHHIAAVLRKTERECFRDLAYEIRRRLAR